MKTLEIEQTLSKLESEVADELAGLGEEDDPSSFAPTVPAKALVGPDAVPAEATTMLDIQKAQERFLELAQGLREPDPGELKAGEVPKMSVGPWATNDQLGREPSLGQDINGPDPSGINRNRGPG
jgi:hypothetical protein